MKGRERLEKTPRLSMSRARRERILSRHAGQCAYPMCEETEGLELDHIVCLSIGGRDTDDNLEPLCGPHHKAKTARDRKLIAKASRLIRKASPDTRKPPRMKSANRWPPKGSQKLQSRGFSQ